MQIPMNGPKVTKWYRVLQEKNAPRDSDTGFLRGLISLSPIFIAGAVK